jgi:hypothetical protein
MLKLHTAYEFHSYPGTANFQHLPQYKSSFSRRLTLEVPLFVQFHQRLYISFFNSEDRFLELLEEDKRRVFRNISHTKSYMAEQSINLAHNREGVNQEHLMFTTHIAFLRNTTLY